MYVCMYVFHSDYIFKSKSLNLSRGPSAGRWRRADHEAEELQGGRREARPVDPRLHQELPQAAGIRTSREFIAVRALWVRCNAF